MRLQLLNFLFVFVFLNAEAQVDLAKLATDLSQTRIEDTSVDMVLWLPSVYWETSTQNFSAVNEADMQQVLLILEPFEIFAIVSAEADFTTNSIVSKSYDEVAGNTSLIFSNSEPAHALLESEVSDKLRQVLEIFRPIMAQMMGQFGSGMHLIAFDRQIDDADLTIDPISQGRLQLRVFDNQFDWRLPLGSLLPARRDPDTMEEFPGNYVYSPFTGTKLVEK